ncbi:MAG: hypothetical protein RJQ14_03135 [Marinoscillum sp.]
MIINFSFQKILTSSGYFLFTTGVLILIFIALKSMTFDSISESHEHDRHPFVWSFILAFALVTGGSIINIFFQKKRPKTRTGQIE